MSKQELLDDIDLFIAALQERIKTLRSMKAECGETIYHQASEDIKRTYSDEPGAYVVPAVNVLRPFVDALRNILVSPSKDGNVTVQVIAESEASNGYGYRAFAEDGGGPLPKLRDGNLLSWNTNVWDKVEYRPLEVSWKNDLFRPVIIELLAEHGSLSFANWQDVSMEDIQELRALVKKAKETKS